MDWDKDGNLLAILQERSNIALLWNAHYNTMVELDTGLKYVGVCRLIPYTYVSKYMFVFFPETCLHFAVGLRNLLP